MSKIEIKNLSIELLKEKLIEFGEPLFRAGQIFNWVFQKNALSFFEMTNVSKESREKLDKNFTIGKLDGGESLSKDGTIKFLLALEDGLKIESVLIPTEERLTLCISSQVGCPLGCLFCLTGKIGFKRNLKVWEIVEQVLHAKRFLKYEKRISNIVLMGMGEPLLNYENVVQAVKILRSKDGLALSRKKITISTAGITPMIKNLSKDCEVKFALSLNAPNNEIRNFLMPINKKYPIEGLISALKDIPMKPREKNTVEYVMIAGTNDREADAVALAKLLKSLQVKVNLIPFNEDPALKFKKPQMKTIRMFRDILKENGITATIRESKGLDIKGACGQLSIIS